MKGKRRSFVAVLLVLGVLTAGAQVSAESIPGELVRTYRSFLQGSIDAFFELVGDDLLYMPMEEFQALPEEIKRNTCLVTVDHVTYRSVMSKAFYAVHDKQRVMEFMERAKDSGGFLFKDLAAKFSAISEKAKHCLRSGVVWHPAASAADAMRFTDGYADTSMEFLLRELYESQVPFVRWVWGTTSPSEERDYMEVLIDSMERKYLLDIAGP